jgi:hypothetical protein
LRSELLKQTRAKAQKVFAFCITLLHPYAAWCCGARRR